VRDLCMCPHTPTCVSSYCYTCVHSWQKSDAGVLCSRVLPTIYVSAYCYICAHILLCVCLHTYYHMCVLILLHLCPHTTICVSSYCYICVLVLLSVSSYCFMCPHTIVYALILTLLFLIPLRNFIAVHSTRLVNLKHFNYYIFLKELLLLYYYMCPHTTI
jgi:hypothetical protein